MPELRPRDRKRMLRQLRELQELPTTLWNIPDDEEVDERTLEDVLAEVYGIDADLLDRYWHDRYRCATLAHHFTWLARAYLAVMIVSLALWLLATDRGAPVLIELGLCVLVAAGYFGWSSARAQARQLSSDGPF